MSLLDTIKQSEEPKTLHQGHWIEVSGEGIRVFVWVPFINPEAEQTYESEAILSIRNLAGFSSELITVKRPIFMEQIV